MKSSRIKMILLALAMCLTAACGKTTGTSVGSTGGNDDGGDGGGCTADAMSVASEEDLEFTMIRIKDGYFDIRRNGDYLEQHTVYAYDTDYPEMEEGTCARVVADVEIYDGGEAGYLHDYFLQDVKSCDPVSYEDVAAEFEIPDAGENNLNMYNDMLVYHDSGNCYLICSYGNQVEAYRDGEFFAEYDLKDIDRLSTPEPFLNDVASGAPYGAEILVQRADPEIEVTAEAFADMMGFTFSVPDDAKDVTYIIDTDTGRGTMGFYLGDVLWNARVMRHDTYLNIEGDYVDDSMEEIRCDFASDPAMTVRGVDPTYVKGYRIKYSEDWEAYMYKALWFLEDEGYIISLANYSETPVDSMPVEVFQ